MHSHNIQPREDTELHSRGSIAEFESEWEEAVAKLGGRWLIYPETHPKNQWEMFEWVKSEQILELLARHKIERGQVLEYGCGAGGVSIFLANQGFHCIALDTSRNALKIANMNAIKHIADVGRVRVDLIQGDVFKLPFKDEGFDIVMSFGLLEHFENRWLDECIVEVLRTLKPGGLFLADIAHGKFSVRTLGITVSFAFSFLYHLLTLRFHRLSNLYDGYFREHYENDLNHHDYDRILKAHGLKSVKIQVCRPFPPLAITGRIDAIYAKIMGLFLPFWKWFDKTEHWLINRIGWVYLASGLK